MGGINSFGGGGDGIPPSKELTIAANLAEQGRAAQERDIAIAANLAEQLNDAQKITDALAVKLADAIKGGGDVDYILKNLGGGARFIFNNLKQIPKNLGEKGFPEPVDLTEEVFPYLNPHPSAADSSRDIIPLDITGQENFNLVIKNLADELLDSKRLDIPFPKPPEPILITIPKSPTE